MTEVDAMEVLTILRLAYPNSYKGITAADAKATVKLWQSMFAEDDGAAVMDAVRSFIKSSATGFPPSIGEISAKLHTIQAACFGEEMTATEAWAKVSKALRNSSYHAADEWAKLPETIRSVIGGPSQLRDWARVEDGATQSVIASQFQRAYAARVAARKELRSFPADVQDTIAQNRREFLGDGAAQLGLLDRGASDCDDLDRALTPEERQARWDACLVNFDEED